MKLSALLILLYFIYGAVSLRPPWYKPCWIFACGLDATDPICGWDPHHGPRIFQNECKLMRHNYCYNRNYALINKEMSPANMVKLCNVLGEVTIEKGLHILVDEELKNRESSSNTESNNLNSDSINNSNSESHHESD